MNHRSITLVTLCLAGFAAPALAVPQSGVYANAQTSIPSGPDNADYHNDPSGPVVSSCRSDDIIGLGTFSIAHSRASFGDLHAYAYSNGGVSGILQNAMGEAAWFDRITITGSVQASMSFNFSLDGTLEQSLPGPFFPASVAGVAGTVGSDSDYEGFSQLAAPGQQTVLTTITLGPFLVDPNVPTDLTMRLLAYVNGVGTADFSSTAHFTGVTVTDASGAPLDVTVSSDSGFNYQVPAPGALPLMALGMCIAGRRRR